MSLTCQVCKTAHQQEVPFCRECGYPMTGEGLALEGRCIGNYRLVERIGGGGFGEVYRAEHVELRKPFAVKILHSRLSSNEQFVERFRTEAKVLAGLQHENVVQVVDFGEHSDIGFYLVMEWLEGRSLHQVWRRKRVFPLGQIYALFSQLLDALQMAHSMGVVHRDMKPDNLLLIKGSRGRTILKIVDFGIATILEARQRDDDPLNQTGIAVGTPYYMSPEQASGRHDLVDHRSDIYACGVILLELLTGRRMFKTKDAKTILRHQIESPPPKLHTLYSKKTYPASLQVLLDRALAKDKEIRFNSAAEMYETLAAVMRVEGVRPDEEGLDETSRTEGKTNLLALVGASGDDHDAAAGGVSTPNYQGQKSTGQGIPSLELAAQSAAPKRQPWALWGGLAFGFVLTLMLGLFLWGPFGNNGNQKKKGVPIGKLPPINARTKADRRKPLPSPPRPEPRDAGAPAASPDAGTSPDPGASPDEGDKRPEPPRVEPRRRRPRRTRPRRRRRRPRRARRTRRRPRPRPRRRIRRRPRPRKATHLTLKVRSAPGGAKVYLDGKLIGKTPLSKRVPAGPTYMIQLKKSGYITSKPYTWRATKQLSRKWTLIEDL